jgi:hypothetical protein
MPSIGWPGGGHSPAGAEVHGGPASATTTVHLPTVGVLGTFIVELGGKQIACMSHAARVAEPYSQKRFTQLQGASGAGGDWGQAQSTGTWTHRP